MSDLDFVSGSKPIGIEREKLGALANAMPLCGHRGPATLDGAERNPGGSATAALGQPNRRASQATTDIEQMILCRNADQVGQRIGQLLLRLAYRFVAPQPQSMMNMLPPQQTIKQ